MLILNSWKNPFINLISKKKKNNNNNIIINNYLINTLIKFVVTNITHLYIEKGIKYIIIYYSSYI